MAAENSVEDYWEDASVSWGCSGLSLSSLSPSPPQSHRHGSLLSKQDFHITSALRPRNFPPPINVCTTLSIKADGRFVLKEMASLPLHSFRAERDQGRLCLHLIEPDESAADSDDDEDGYRNYDDNNNACNVEDDSVCLHLQCQQQPDGYKVLASETMNEDICMISDEEGKHVLNQGCMPQELEDEALLEKNEEMHVRPHEDMPEAHMCRQKASTSGRNAAKKIDVWGINGLGEGCNIQSTECARESDSRKNEGGAAYMDMLGIGQHHLRSKEGSNGIDMAASLSPCSSKQVLSFSRTSPPLGLAVS